MNSSLYYTKSCWSRTFIANAPEIAQIFFTGLFCMFGLVGSSVNGISIYLFIRWGLLRRSINKLYFSLFISGLLISTVFTLMKLLQIHLKENCGITTFGRYVAVLIPVSTTNVAAISYAQYKHLKSVHTFNAFVQKPDTLWLLLISWCSPIVLILSLAISMLVLMVVGFVFLLGYFIVFFLCYRMVISQLLRQYKQGRDLTLSREERANVCTLHKESTELIGLIMLNAVVCTLPMFVFLVSVILLEATEKPIVQPHTAVQAGTAQLFFVINSCLNVILCFYKHRDLKKAAMKSRRSRNKVQPNV